MADYDYNKSDDSAAGAASAGLSNAGGSAGVSAMMASASGAEPMAMKPRILLMGLKRSGKSSIVKVVFQKLSPNETIFLESTTKIAKSAIAGNSFIHFHVWDFPGQINFFDSQYDADDLFKQCDALVFVIDAQEEDYSEALQKLHMTVSKAHEVNSKINFDVFLHKVDGLSDDHKIEVQEEIQHRVQEDLHELKLESKLRFHLTSIYDHSIFEAFSKVAQRLIPNMDTLSRLLDALMASCRLEKAFLIDVVSKLYIASDQAPLDPHSYELCADMIDVVVDISCIYGHPTDASPLAYDENSRGIIKLGNGMVLYLREMTRHLALVCILREENFDKHGVLEYNFVMLRESIRKVFTRMVASKARTLK